LIERRSIRLDQMFEAVEARLVECFVLQWTLPIGEWILRAGKPIAAGAKVTICFRILPRTYVVSGKNLSIPADRSRIRRGQRPGPLRTARAKNERKYSPSTHLQRTAPG
jgi:hypothetical protein